jgi:hypothetical protein
MEKLVVILSVGAVVGSMVLPGCSKPKNAAIQSGNSTDASAASSTAESPVEMKIKWTVGKKYPLRMELIQSSKTDVPDQPQPVTQETKVTQDFNILALKELDNGGHQLELTFENETMNVSQGGHSVLSFDSTQNSAPDANNPVAPMLRAMLGAHIEFFTDAKGEFERMEGLDELRSRVTAGGKQQEQAVFDAMFNEDTLKQYCSFADAMPDHAVKIGDSWRLKKDVPSRIGVLTLDMKYTFKNWEQIDQRKCAHVVASGDISTKTVSTTSGAEIEIKKGNISGEFWYDPALGMIVDANNDMNMTLKVTTRAQTMTSQFTQNSRVALVDSQ